jgi:hypothetical protein
LNKIVLRKTTSAMFLAIVLVLGTIAFTAPSFMTNAQATSDRERDYDNDEDKKSYDKDDKDYDKSKKESNSVFVKKVKCNNINVNLNGINANIGLPNNGPVTSPIAVAQEEEEEDDEKSNSIERNDDESDEGRDRQSDSNTNSKIVCINNNNNIVAIGEPEPPTCEECFTKVLSEEEEKLDDLIQAIIEDGGPDSLQGLCEFIAGDLSEEGRAFISDRLLVLGEDVEISEDKINEILDCLEEVFGGDFPREILEEPLTAQQQMNWNS